MNTKTIIEALELAAELIPYSKEDPTEPSQSGREFMSSDKWIASVNDVANKVQQALTLLRSPSEPGEGPYQKVECGSNRPGSVKFYRIKGPDDEMDYALHGNDVDYHLKRLNAAYRAGCISAGIQQGEPVAWMSESGKVISAKAKLHMEEAEHPIGIHYDIPLVLAHPPQVDAPQPDHQQNT